METVHFIIPEIREIREALSQLGLDILIPAVLGFILGSLLSRILTKRRIGAIHFEIQALKVRQRSAETLLDRTPASPDPPPTPESAIELEPSEDQAAEDTDRIDTSSLAAGELSEADQRAGDARGMAERKRIVRLVEVFGKAGKVKIPTSIIGFEETHPAVGKCYRLTQMNGLVFRTSPVTRIGVGYIRTENAVYEMEIVGRE